MHRRLRDKHSAPNPAQSAHPVRPALSERPAGPAGLRTLPLLATAAPWLGVIALWACLAPPLLDRGHTARVTAGSALAVAALLLSAVLALRAHRSLSTRLGMLRASARELAEHGLPHAATRLTSGQLLDVAEVVPELRLGNDALGRTAHEITVAHRAAVALAVRQSDSRENVRKVFLNLARRTQALIHRQIAMLDSMERDHEDPDLLQELFAVDHLSTRLRRHAENLVILGGALPPRQWRHGVPLMDVVRSAVSETEEYTRIEVENLPRTTVSGRAVADVVHLLAELLENGCMFSPPHTHVTITGEDVSHGLVLEIEDRGLGMADDQYRRLNALLANPAGFDSGPMGEDGRLGMFVVGRLAHRHGVNVELRRSAYGGTRVIVLLPQGLVETQQPTGAASPAEDSTPSAPTSALPWAQAASDETAAAVAELGPGAGEYAGFDLDGVGGPDALDAVAASGPSATDLAPLGPEGPYTFAADGADTADPARAHSEGAESPQAADVRERPRHEESSAGIPLSPAPWDLDEPPATSNGPNPAVRFGSLGELANSMAAMSDAAARSAPDSDEGASDDTSAAEPPLSIPAQATSGPAEAIIAPTDETSTTPRVLPKRVRRASLAAQLRESAAAEEALGAQRATRRTAPAPTAEASRATMAAIQRATRLARDSEPRDARATETGGDDSPAPAPKDQL